MSHQLIQIISAGGLLAIFLTMAAASAGIPISSEIVVPLGGALAAQGKLSFVGVVIAASAGNLLGSLVAYLLVRRFGEALILGPGRRVCRPPPPCHPHLHLVSSGTLAHHGGAFLGGDHPRRDPVESRPRLRGLHPGPEL